MGLQCTFNPGMGKGPVDGGGGGVILEVRLG